MDTPTLQPSPLNNADAASGGRNPSSDLDLIQTVYGITLVLGLERVAETVCRLRLEAGEGGHSPEVIAVAVLGAAVLCTLGMRFFWAVGNIRRFILRRAARGSEALRQRITTVHFPVLLLHGFVYYYLCRIYESAVAPGGSLDRAAEFVCVYCTFLALNAAWLASLVKGLDDRRPESEWIANNLACSAAAAVAYWSVPLATGNPVHGFYAAAAVFLVNSHRDLHRTARAYITTPIRREVAVVTEQSAAAGHRSEHRDVRRQVEPGTSLTSSAAPLENSSV